MRASAVAVVLAFTAWSVGAASAQEKPGEPPPATQPAEAPEPLTTEEAADAALAAVAAKDAAALKSLAAKDDPDPWLVADELCARGKYDEADAFAKAAPRVDVEKLPAYVASRRGKAPDADARRELAAANTALAAEKPADAFAAIEGAKPADEPVVAIRLEHARGLALRGAKRLEESAAAFGAAAAAADGLGWRARAANGFYEQGTSAYVRRDLGTVRDAWSRRLDVEQIRGGRAEIAAAAGDLGVAHFETGEYAKALELHLRALQLEEELGERAGMAVDLANLGLVHDALGDYAKARDCHERALRLMEESGNRSGVAFVLMSLGVARMHLGESGAAEETLRRALRLAEDLGDAAVTSRALTKLGLAVRNLGKYAEAMDLHRRSLELNEAAGSRAGVSGDLTNLGIVQEELGAFASALDFHRRALAIDEELEDPEDVSRDLSNLGNVYEAIGEYAKALDVGERALKLLEAAGDRAGLARSLTNLGNVHEDLGECARALDFHQRALRLDEELGDRLGTAKSLTNVGNVHMKSGDRAAALECYQRALRIKEELGDRAGVARSLTNLVAVHADLGESATCLDLLQRAMGIVEELGDRAGMATTLTALANVHEELGDLAKALDLNGRALIAAREIGLPELEVANLAHIAFVRRAAGSPRDAAAAAREAVDRMSGLVGGVGDEQASSARSRHRNVYDTGASAAADLGDAALALFFVESGRAGALLEALKSRDTVAAKSLPPTLAEAERAARLREAAAANALRRALAGGDVETAEAARGELDAARHALLLAIERIQRDAKAVAGVAYPKADSLDAIRARLHTGDALVLYRLADDEFGGAIAVVVTAKDARIVALGKAGDIAAACAALAPDECDADPTSAVVALRESVVDPLALDAKTTRVLVSPDGALSYVPFALLLPDRDVCYVPSGTTYGVLLDDASKRGEGVLALGDPDYGAKSEHQATAVAMRGGMKLVPLPATGVEAKSIGDVVLLGKDATESRLSAEIAKKPRWRAVHLACHGLVDPERPMLSSLAVTPSATDDGFLTALDVFRMKCPADLVVLSACETGKGKVYRAEGIVGLTRAFMFAGAPRVLVSLWKVDDEATAALMTKFYEAWKKGVPAARALRDAQQFVRAQEKWKHPAYWAAWVMWGLG